MTEMQTIRPDLEALPLRLQALPVNDKGYPVPWFVAWIDGKPEFRCADQRKLHLAIRDKRCWVCGEPLGRFMSFLIGPMCGINRTTAEPPCHLECAEWSARNCPFLANANRKRNEDEEINCKALIDAAPGMAITRNPGVCLIWTTREYQIFRPHNGGILFKVGEPESVKFYASGRLATREEVAHSVDTGLPILRNAAAEEGAEALWELERLHKAFVAMYPATGEMANA